MEVTLPSLETVWATMRCKDCRSTVTVVLSHDSVPMLRVIHSYGCTIPPDLEHRVYWTALPLSYTATHDQEEK